MPDVQFGSGLGSRTTYKLPVQPLVNWFAEEAPAQPTRGFNLLPTPGLKEFATIDTNVRLQALYREDGVLLGEIFAVADRKLYKTDLAGANVQEIGSLGAEGGAITGTARIAGLRGAVAVLGGNSGSVYLYDGTSLERITDTDLGSSVVDIASINQRLVAINGRDQIVWSEVLDFDDFDGLSFAVAERAPDRARALLVKQQELWVMGAETIEVFVDEGGTAVFVPLQGGFIERGLITRNAAIVENNTVYWVGDDRVVYVADGYLPRAISNNYVAEQLSKVPFREIEDISMWSYSQDGHKFVGIRTKCNGTYVYDTTTGMWHERESRSETRKTYRIFTMIEIGSTVIGADRKSGKLFQLDPNTFTDDGEEIERTASAYVPVRARTPCETLAIDCTKGQGDNDTEIPQIMLRYSDDQGRTFSNEKWKSLGRSGEYQSPVCYRQLGMMKPPGRIFQIKISDANRVAIYGARLNDRDP